MNNESEVHYPLLGDKSESQSKEIIEKVEAGEIGEAPSLTVNILKQENTFDSSTTRIYFFYPSLIWLFIWCFLYSLIYLYNLDIFNEIPMNIYNVCVFCALITLLIFPLCEVVYILMASPPLYYANSKEELNYYTQKRLCLLKIIVFVLFFLIFTEWSRDEVMTPAPEDYPGQMDNYMDNYKLVSKFSSSMFCLGCLFLIYFLVVTTHKERRSITQEVIEEEVYSETERWRTGSKRILWLYMFFAITLPIYAYLLSFVELDFLFNKSNWTETVSSIVIEIGYAIFITSSIFCLLLSFARCRSKWNRCTRVIVEAFLWLGCLLMNIFWEFDADEDTNSAWSALSGFFLSFVITFVIWFIILLNYCVFSFCCAYARK